MLMISKGVFKKINKDYVYIYTLINEEKIMKSTKTLK